MGDRVAGHEFKGSGSDQRCTGCERWWTDIMDCTDADIGKPNLAHSGCLNMAELTEIREKRKYELRFWDAIEAQVG